MANYQIVSKWDLGKKVDVLSIESISKKKNSNQKNSQSINYSNNSHSNTIHNSVVLFVFIMISLFLFFSFRSNEVINEESSLNDSTYEIKKDIDSDEQKIPKVVTHSERENKIIQSHKENKKVKSHNLESKTSDSQNVDTEQNNNAAKDLTSLSGL